MLLHPILLIGGFGVVGAPRRAADCDAPLLIGVAPWPGAVG
jgi:hypothetical protein